MHFWINKPAGRTPMIGGCGRYHAAAAAVTASSIPATIPLLKTRGAGRGFRGPMLSPNRSLNWAVVRTGEPRSVQNRPFPEGVTEPRQSNRRGQPTNTISNSVTNAGHSRRVISTDPNVNRGILDFSEMGDADLAGYKLRCGVWITFVLATGFVSIAKIYFGNRTEHGLDVLIFCGLLVTLLISGCFFTLTRRARNVDRGPTNHEEVCRHNICFYTINPPELRPQVSTLRVPVVSPTPPPISPSPPPYHIAILIPPADTSDIEAPPPSYDKATRPTETSSVSE